MTASLRQDEQGASGRSLAPYYRRKREMFAFDAEKWGAIRADPGRSAENAIESNGGL